MNPIKLEIFLDDKTLAGMYHEIKIILLRFSTKISEDVEKPIGWCIFLRKNVVK